MKNLCYFILAALAAASLSGCSGRAEQEKDVLAFEEKPESSTAPQQEEQAKEIPAVSIWDKISVRDSPDEKGKWLTSLSIGESIIYLNKRQADAGDDNKTYYKIRLNDGKEGWARADFVVPEAQAGVFTRETNMYKRPDLLTKSDLTFSKMDIVAVMEKQDDWLKIRGKRTGGKWIDEGWIKASNISYETVDIATAKFAKSALAEENEEKKQAAIQEILHNSDLKTSVFISDLSQMVSQQAEEEIIQDDVVSEYLPASDSL